MPCAKIPGGAQLNSKRMYNYSDKYPTHYLCAKGIDIVVPKRPALKDFSTMGIGCCILGYRDEEVDNAVKLEIQVGNMTSLNSLTEIRLADKLMEIHPYFDMVRYFKTGGEALSAAVRVARTNTGKDKVISIGYHGWHDWWLSGNLENKFGVSGHLGVTTHAGVPCGLTNSNIFCDVNDDGMLFDALVQNNYNIAAIVFEYARYEKPTEDFLKVLRSAQAAGIILIADEVTTGWRYRFGGMHMDYRDIFTPDLVVYGKAISNGYPFSCVIGKESVMKSFLDTFISSTYWTESLGMAAALATINVLEKENYIERNLKQDYIGDILEDRLNAKVSGINGLMHYTIPGMELNQWCDKMLDKGYLVTNNLYLSFNHTWNDINAFVEAL